MQVPALRRPAQREFRHSIRFVGKLLGHAVGATHLEVVNAFQDKYHKGMIVISLTSLCHISSCLEEVN